MRLFPETKTGNVNESTLSAIASGEQQKKFEASGAARPAQCAACGFSVPCGAGGCRRDFVTEENGSVRNYFCPAYREFFAYAMERLEQIAAMERRMR